jgi:hypothetical protein
MKRQLDGRQLAVLCGSLGPWLFGFFWLEPIGNDSANSVIRSQASSRTGKSAQQSFAVCGVSDVFSLLQAPVLWHCLAAPLNAADAGLVPTAVFCLL